MITRKYALLFLFISISLSSASAQDTPIEWLRAGLRECREVDRQWRESVGRDNLPSFETFFLRDNGDPRSLGASFSALESVAQKQEWTASDKADARGFAAQFTKSSNDLVTNLSLLDRRNRSGSGDKDREFPRKLISSGLLARLEEAVDAMPTGVSFGPPDMPGTGLPVSISQTGEIPEAIKRLRQDHDENVRSLDQPFVELNGKFLEYLGAQKTTFQKSGDLEGVLAVESEIAQFKGVPGDRFSRFDAIKRLQEIYKTQWSALEAERQKRWSVLAGDFRERAAGIASELTKAGKLDEAKLALAESQRLGSIENGQGSGQAFPNGLPDSREKVPASADQETDPGFENLLSTENEGHWVQCGPGRMTISRGESVSSSSGGVGIAWYDKKEFSDFILKLEFKGEAPEFNSGIRLRLPKLGSDPSVGNQLGYEVAIHRSEKPYKWETGSIHGEKTPITRALRPDDWNEFEITVTGQDYKVLLNGQLVNQFRGDRALSGFIGIEENPFGSVRFRNIRIQELPGSTTAPVPNTPGSSEGRATFHGMVLAPDWLPERLGVDQKYTEDLRYYSQRVVAGEAGRGTNRPGKIWGDLEWLMPVDLAIKSFDNVSAVSSTRITNQSYPHDSLTLHGFNAKVEDLGYRFNRVFLISDKKGQLVSVQFVAQAPKVTVWLPLPVEDRNPVYDLVNVKRNASTGNQVSFQIVAADPGVEMIKLVLRKPLARMEIPPGVGVPQPAATPVDLKWLEDSHWYLPVPLAERFIEIADSALK